MTTSDLAKEVFSIVEAKISDKLSPGEFELAYQARVAIEKIRFAIKQIDSSKQNIVHAQEAVFQLCDALDRLEAADRHFQERFRLRRTYSVCGERMRVTY